MDRYLSSPRAVVWAGLLTVPMLLSPVPAVAGQDKDSNSEGRIQQGLAIAPVPLNLHGNNRALVGLGSYLVNALGGCNDCHTCPTYVPGVEHNPFIGGMANSTVTLTLPVASLLLEGSSSPGT
jgi:hypothetical protein